MTKIWAAGGCVTLVVGVATAFLSPVATQAQVDSTLIKVRATGADSLPSGLPVFYSSGQEPRARALQALLSDAGDYLAANLDVQVDIYLAVLDESQWGQVWPFPYGLPYVSLAAPWTAVLPASQQLSVLFPDFEQMLGATAAAQMVDNIGFHEIGHVYVSEYVYGGRVTGAPPVRWLDEFLATYLAYAFLESESHDGAAVWEAFTSASIAGPRPTFTSLASFEAEYYGYLGSPEGSPNYSWYQAAFAEHVADVYAQHGLNFVTDLRDQLLASPPSSWTTESVLEVLERLAPGTRAWAEGLDAPDGGA